MPTLIETIGEYDEDLLLMIAEGWGIDKKDLKSKKLAPRVADYLHKEDMARDLITTLPDQAISALRTIAANQGRIPWQQFIRKFGELREIGAGRRLRERPDIDPISITETLYYKALVGKAFFDTRGGPSEFAYIPDEFMPLIDAKRSATILDLLKPANQKNVTKKLIANDFIIDHACTLLAALRIGIPLEGHSFSRPDVPVNFLVELLKDMRLLTSQLKINADQVKAFLESTRGNALFLLKQIWMKSTSINELVFLPTLEFEGKPRSNPQSSRLFLLESIKQIPDSEWFGIEEFIHTIHDTQPDLLRTGGEYDAWFVKNRETGAYLSGFAHWYEIEGAYIRYMINGPLFWLGIIDLGKSPNKKPPIFFRKSQWANNLLLGDVLEYPTLDKKDFNIDKSGSIVIDRYFPRDIRYQISRFCEWEAQKGNRFYYRINAASLKRMEEQELTTKQLLSIIQKYGRKPIPVNITKALERWEKYHREAGIEKDVLIKVTSPEILDKLMASQAKKYIRSRLNPQTALVDSSGISYLNIALLEIGVFSEIELEV